MWGYGSTAKYNTTNLIKHIQKHHAKEHLQLNKTKEAAGTTAQQLTVADELQRCEKFLMESLKASAITSFRIHCFRCSTNVSC